MNHQDPQQDELGGLFRAYREACPDPEPDPNFMARLWQRIDAQQSFARDLRWLTEGLVTAAALLSLLMGIFLVRRESPVSFYSSTYMEVLADQEREGESVAEMIPVALDRF